MNRLTWTTVVFPLAGNAQPRWYLEFIFGQRSTGRMLFSVPSADIELPLCFHKQWQGKTEKFVPVMGEATYQPTFSQWKSIPNVCLALWEHSHPWKRKGIIWNETVNTCFLSSFLSYSLHHLSGTFFYPTHCTRMLSKAHQSASFTCQEA